ncbi:BT_3928 family protein [Owenweeksia hongkongensis]|uniref:BT_3928 family protein n=1 Tax=Owenweeksia hongkongensis TaxID=253245 RepID=UPI003A8D1BA5
MRFITQVSRVLVGALFIFSGFIKLNDPVGFSFKLDEYFGVDVLNLPFLQPFALAIAVFVVILEVLLGVALLIGFKRKLTSWLLLLMIVFFTFLTFYSAYFNKVTDCGCFGDAIPLTPWQSFGKDVVLSILILIIFFNQQYINPILRKSANIVVMAFSLVACALFGNHVLNHLPAIDFRAYAVGKSISEGMKSAEELGVQATEYGTIYVMKNTSTGEEKKISSKAYVDEKWWENKEWEMLSDKTETVVLVHGYEPPVHDFVMTLEDEDITDQVLNMPAVFLVISYKMEITDDEAYAKINEFAGKAEVATIPLYGVSASLPEVVDQKRHELQTPFPYAVMDETTLKTIVRSNPGIVLLKHGRVAAKWHHNDLPDFAEVQKEYL